MANPRKDAWAAALAMERTRLPLMLQERGALDVLVFLTEDTRRSLAALESPARAAADNLAAAVATADPAAAEELSLHFISSSQRHDLAADALARRGASSKTMRALGAGLKLAARAEMPPSSTMFPRLGVMVGAIDERGLSALERDKRVAAVVEKPTLQLIRPIGRPQHVEAAAASGNTWGIDAMKVPALWKEGLSGKGVLVGHLDTGVDATHPALRDAIGAFEAFDWNGNPTHPDAMQDTDEHGTHTAGTIAGRPVGSTRIGVAPGALLATATVIEGGDPVVRVLAGMDWAIGEGIRVLSLSLGFPGYVASFLLLTQILRSDRGILPVFAVGNEGPGTSRSPGNYSEALSVGAADSSGQVAYFSSSQRFNRPADPLVPDVLAPGVDVVSACPGGEFQAMSGTSTATPHVAGLAALLFEAKPTATVDEVEHAIVASTAAHRPHPVGRSSHGTPDARAALDALTGTRAKRGGRRRASRR